MSPPRLNQGADALGVGLTWAASVALFAWLGSLLDERAGTTPLFVAVGAVLGAVGGFIHFVSRVAPGMLPFGKHKSGSSSDSERPPKSE